MALGEYAETCDGQLLCGRDDARCDRYRLDVFIQPTVLSDNSAPTRFTGDSVSQDGFNVECSTHPPPDPIVLPLFVRGI